MIWRIYRLPGSRQIWHIDSGPGTQIFNVKGFDCAESHSVDIGGDNVPRAWVEVRNQELHIVNGKAFFDYAGVAQSVREVLEETKCHKELIKPDLAAAVE